MRKTLLSLSLLGMVVFVVASGSAQKKDTASKPTQDSVVITFKDGHSQRYPVADVAKIEFESANAETADSSSGHFLGKWKVGDGMGGTFFITLERDGKAYKTFGHDYGRWKVVGDEARITWDDGWRDVIRKAGNRYEKVAFHPGKTFSDAPDHIADASSTDPI
jgi:hypothetical protein